MDRVDQTRRTSYPKHSAAAAWAIAAAPALNITDESVLQALEQKGHFAIPTNPLLPKIMKLMATREDWQGTATQLKLELDLPIAPNHLSRQLKEVQPTLLDQGIKITFPPRRESGQLIHIAKLHKNNPTDRPPENSSSDRQSDQNEGEPIKVAAEQHQMERVVLPEQIRHHPLEGRNSLDLDRAVSCTAEEVNSRAPPV